jgi:hypothetical protein
MIWLNMYDYISLDGNGVVCYTKGHFAPGVKTKETKKLSNPIGEAKNWS